MLCVAASGAQPGLQLQARAQIPVPAPVPVLQVHLCLRHLSALLSALAAGSMSSTRDVERPQVSVVSMLANTSTSGTGAIGSHTRSYKEAAPA